MAIRRHTDLSRGNRYFAASDYGSYTVLSKKEEKSVVDLEKLRERVKIYGEIFKEWLEALTGKKDLKSKVDVLASPDNLKSMSVLSDHAYRFVVIANYVSEVEEWGEKTETGELLGMFDGLRDYARQIMKASPSKAGLGREQVIRFMGAVEESKLVKGLNLSLGGKTEEGETKE